MERLLALLRLALLAAAIALPPSLQAATFQITVNTSAFSGTPGQVDFQFNPFGDAPPATAAVTAFSGPTLGPGLDFLGTASGSLPDDLTLGNDDGLNAALQDVTYGTSLSFLLDVTVSGPGSGFTSFFLGIYDTSLEPLLAANGEGLSLGIEFPATGVPVIDNFAPSLITVAAVESIPEPGTLPLLAAGLITIVMAARRSGRRGTDIALRRA